MKIDEHHIRYRAELVAKLLGGRVAMDRAIKAYNTALRAAFREFERAAESFADIVGEVNDFTQQVAEDLQGEIDDKSERWRESEAGQNAIELLEEWQAYSAKLPEYSDPEEVEELDPDDTDVTDLEGLPEEHA